MQPAAASATTADSWRLSAAAEFAVQAGSTITNSGVSVIDGNIGLTPGSAVTGFETCTGPANCVVHDGTMHISDGVAQQAKADLQSAYGTLVGLEDTCTAVAVELGGTTLLPGVYCSPTLGLTGTLTLDGEGEFIFLTGAGGSTLITAAGSQVRLINGADACDVYFQVASSATIGTGSQIAGNILARTSISFGAAATLDGSAQALTGAVTLINNTITNAGCSNQPVITPPGDGTALPGGGGALPPVDDGGARDDAGAVPPGDTGSLPDSGGAVPPGDTGALPGSGGSLPPVDDGGAPDDAGAVPPGGTDGLPDDGGAVPPINTGGTPDDDGVVLPPPSGLPSGPTVPRDDTGTGEDGTLSRDDGMTPVSVGADDSIAGPSRASGSPTVVKEREGSAAVGSLARTGLDARSTLLLSGFTLAMGIGMLLSGGRRGGRAPSARPGRST